VYLLKDDVINFEQIFENFNASDYAKTLLDAELNKNKECDKITEDDIDEEEKNYSLKSTRDYIVNMCKKDIAVKYDYLEKLKVKGIKGIINGKEENMSISDMKEYLRQEYGENPDIDADINHFVESFIKSTVLFRRSGVDGIDPKNVINLQENIGWDSSLKTTIITHSVVNSANIDV
jgi:hypothetical protein